MKEGSGGKPLSRIELRPPPYRFLTECPKKLTRESGAKPRLVKAASPARVQARVRQVVCSAECDRCAAPPVCRLVTTTPAR